MGGEWIFSFKHGPDDEFDLEEYHETLRTLKAEFAHDGGEWAESEAAASRTNIWCEFTTRCSCHDWHKRHDGRIVASWRLYWDPTIEDNSISDTHARCCEDIKRPSFSIQRVLQRKFPNNFELYLDDGCDGSGAHCPAVGEAVAPTTGSSSDSESEDNDAIDEPQQSSLDDILEAYADMNRELKIYGQILRHLKLSLLPNLKLAIEAAEESDTELSWEQRESYIKLPESTVRAGGSGTVPVE